MSKGIALLILIFSSTLAAAQTAKEFFTELRDAGGLNQLAQLVCFPNPGQDLDTDFIVVAFSKDFASTLRAQGKPVEKEFLDAEKAPEKDRVLIQWIYRNGVQRHDEPEVLQAIVGNKGARWSADSDMGKPRRRFTLRMVFSAAGRYSRDVLVDGVLQKSFYGRCEPIE